MRSRARILLPTALAGLSAALPGPLAAQEPRLPAVADALQRMVDDLALDSAGLVIASDQEELHRSVHGKLAAHTALPIASASKWLAVATILSLVEDGVLDLDHPVARYVEEFDRDDKRRVTLRQCLSCTGGLPAQLGDRMRNWDMRRFAAAAADAPLRVQPGATFLYGGVGFQLAAVAAERATGKDWHTLFHERIGAPLGLVATRFGTLVPPGGDAGRTALPWVAGGAVSSLDDYAKFVRMLLGRGEFEGSRVLAEHSVAAMLRDQVPQLVDVKAVGLEARDVRYGLGTWLVALPGGGLRATDPGAFGFTPWIDLDLGIGGVLAVQDRVQRVLRHLGRVQQAARDAAQAPAVAGPGETIALRHGGRPRQYLLHVPTHAPGPEGLPLLLVLHGGGGHAEQVRDNTGIAEPALASGFAVVFPNGTGRLPRRLLTWNSGGIDVYAQEQGIDDVGFLRAVVADVERRVPIDRQRIFAAGHSNGGMMCHRLAREAADLFAGIAVVAGAMNFTAADAETPIAVLLVHGTADRHVRFNGGDPETGLQRAARRTDASVQQAVDYYVARNQLVAYPRVQIDGKVRIDSYTSGKAGGPAAPVQVIALDGGGHAWPGSRPSGRLLADEPFPFDAAAAIVTFFRSLQPSGQLVAPPPAASR